MFTLTTILWQGHRKMIHKQAMAKHKISNLHETFASLSVYFVCSIMLQCIVHWKRSIIAACSYIYIFIFMNQC